jgi:four helix bundle protein
MQNNNVKVRGDVRTRAYSYALSIIRFLDGLNQRDLSVQVIAKQLLRSATSIGANIIEAQSGSTRRDFTNFYTHALKSANESKFWLGLLRDTDKGERVSTDALLQETHEIASILGASILTLRGKK